MQVVFLVWGAAFTALALFLKLRKKEKEFKVKNIVPENKTLIDYNVYLMSKGEWFFYFALASGAGFLLAYLFYRNFLVAFLLLPLAVFYPRWKTVAIIQKRKQELSLQFKEALYALSSSLQVGRSLESAFSGALKDLALLYPDPQTYIIQEFTYLRHRLAVNETIEEALSDFARRAHLEDLDNFVDVLVISKRTGGNLVEIIKNTATIIGEKLQIKQEIATHLAQRKLEQKILQMMPLVMLFLLSWTTGDYMEPVFITGEGRLIMTVALLFLALANYLAYQIMLIEV